ncbi:ShlB/FhaC/HecB family hemolysin secretion/activation protein [Pseudomonas aeruginosa]
MSLGPATSAPTTMSKTPAWKTRARGSPRTQLGFNHGRRIGSGFVNLDLGWLAGHRRPWRAGSRPPAGGDPHARYDKHSLTLSYLQPFQLWGRALQLRQPGHRARSERRCSARSASASAATARCAASRTRP